MQQVIRLTREVVLNPGCLCPSAGLVYKTLRLWVPNPDQLNQDRGGRDSVSIIPGLVLTLQSDQALLWCLPIALGTSLSSYSGNRLQLCTYILKKRQHPCQTLLPNFKRNLVLSQRESVAHQRRWLPLQASWTPSHSMTRSFLLVCTLPTASHVWPSMSKSFTTEISGWPFSFFVHPEEETVCYRVGLLLSLILWWDREKSSHGSLKEKYSGAFTFSLFAAGRGSYFVNVLSIFGIHQRGKLTKYSKIVRQLEFFSPCLFQKCWHPRKWIGNSKL